MGPTVVFSIACYGLRDPWYGGTALCTSIYWYMAKPGTADAGSCSNLMKLFQHLGNIINKMHEYFWGSLCSPATARVVEHAKMS